MPYGFPAKEWHPFSHRPFGIIKMLTNNVMALKGKRARRVAGLSGRREYENIFLLWQNKEFLETEVFKEYHARVTQMGVLYMPIMVMSIFAAGSALTHLLSFPSPPRWAHGPRQHRAGRTRLGGGRLPPEKSRGSARWLGALRRGRGPARSPGCEPHAGHPGLLCRHHHG